MKWARRVLLGVMIAIGLILLFNKQIASFLINREPDISKESIVIANRNQGPINYDEITSLTAMDILKAQLSNQKANYIGIVSVPKLGLKQPIVNELSNYALSVGAAIYYNDMKMGENNYVLASHFSYTGKQDLFSPLYYNLSQGVVGQEIYLTDLDYLYTYKTTDYKVVTINETEYINEESNVPKITLFTCNYTSEAGRVILQGELVKKEKIDDSLTEKINTIF